MNAAEDAQVSAHSNWTWDEMLESFRALGGTADNVVCRNGPLGRGIFPRDPKKLVSIHVPPNLLICDDDVEFRSGVIAIKRQSHISEKERIFFENYQRAFSWGDGGNAEAARFYASLDALPSDVRELLIRDFGCKDLLNDGSADRIERRFFETRRVMWKGKLVCMPLVELLNHGPQGQPYSIDDSGVSVKGRFEGEVLARYGWEDALGIFVGWGFASPEPQAFSLPVKLNLGQRRLVVGRDIQAAEKRGEYRFPKLAPIGNALTLSYLMIGHAGFPRLSKAIFYRLMKENGMSDAEGVFDQIQHFNRTRFLKLLAALEPHAGESIDLLRRVVRHQLEAMSHYVGSREI